MDTSYPKVWLEKLFQRFMGESEWAGLVMRYTAVYLVANISALQKQEFGAFGKNRLLVRGWLPV